MKPSFPLCLGVVFAGFTSSSGHAPTAPRPRGMSPNAEATHTGGTAATSPGSRSQSSSGKSGRSTLTQTNLRSESIQITVRNFGTLPGTAQVEWRFVAAPAKMDTSAPVATVRVVADGKALDSEASKTPLAEIVKDNARLDAMKEPEDTPKKKDEK